MDCQDGSNCTPLHLVETTQAARVLLAAGADARVLDKRRASVLFSPAALADGDLYRDLIAAGADPRKGDHRDEHPLHFAQSVGVVESLLTAGVNVTALERCTLCPLASPAALRDAAACKVLLAAGANPNCHARPLALAESPEVVRVLLEAGADPDAGSPPPLFSPAVLTHPEATRTLIAAGADMRNSPSRTPLLRARTRGVVEVLLAAGAIVTGKGDANPLLSPAATSDAAVCQMLLAAGVKVHHRGGARVLNAARTAEVVAVLLSAGAPLCPDALLWVTAARASADVCRALIAAGASVHAEDERGNRPLHFAHTSAVVEALVAAGAVVNHLNASHKSALHITNDAHNDVTTALLAAGARVDFSKNGEELTPLHTARHPSGVQALIRAGTKRDSSGPCVDF